MKIIITIINWFSCLLDQHNTYSIADDLNFEFSDFQEEMQRNSVEENLVLFEDLTAIRCRHCNYLFMPTKDRPD